VLFDFGVLFDWVFGFFLWVIFLQLWWVLRAGGKPATQRDSSANVETKQSVDRVVTDDVSPKPGFVNGSALSTETTVSITVVGASGDLAKKKIFPALFALYYEGCLPKVCLPNYRLPIEFAALELVLGPVSFANWIYCFGTCFVLTY